MAVVGFALCPWNLVNNGELCLLAFLCSSLTIFSNRLAAATFISVLSSYSIFLGPLAGSTFSDSFPSWHAV